MVTGLFRASCALLCLLLASAAALHAQRTLDWDAVQVTAHLDEDGRLQVDEHQTMVFDGDWNGGERVFNIRPRQSFKFIGLYREQGGTWVELSEDDYLDAVDEYSWVDGETLRWRSRLPSDAPFASTRIRYLLRYELSNILLKDEAGYRLDHDFLFPDRDGVIRRFELRFTLDPAWRPSSTVEETYTAQNIDSGRGFVLTVPLTYEGTGVPAVLDTSRSREVQIAVSLIAGITLLGMGWVFVRESARGRFAPLHRNVDEGWLRENVLNHPAEVVGAAWDDTIDTAEVVALIARLVSEGKLESTVRKSGHMSLKLKVPRETLTSYERTLVDRLFFNDRTNTSTELVKQHYRKQGFNPVEEIRAGLTEAMTASIPDGHRWRPLRFASPVLLLAGFILLIADWSAGRLDTPVMFFLGIATLILVVIAANVGSRFRSSIQWTRRAMALSFLPVLLPAAGVTVFLWSYVGLGAVAASTVLIAAITTLTLAIIAAGFNTMVSRQRRAGVAFRKRLAAGRAYFIEQLAQPQPALHDDWSPWLLALGLGKQMEDWSAQRDPGDRRSSSTSGWTSTDSSSGGSSSSPTWTGFAGGRSGGGGGGAAWTAAASGLAAGVAPPSSSSSSGGGGSSSSSSSSGGSSGGGGGGGW